MNEIMKNYNIKITSNVNMDVIWEFLSALGITVLYSDEDASGSKDIYIELPAEKNINTLKDLLPGCLSIEVQTLPEIDWYQQWQFHGHDFHDGKVHINLSNYGFIPTAGLMLPTCLALQPGPGFGDLSHPTTGLVLELMANDVKVKNVIDIGCGSGVLALAAIAQGAERVMAVDIDPKALEHTRCNALLNNMETKIKICLPKDLGLINEDCMVLMNMISSEQRIAWKTVKPHLPKLKKVYTSGIRASEKDEYLTWVSQWNWKEVRCLEKEQWLGFEFVCSSST
jgi:ribosomal protein L11 methyltransferase